MPPTSSVTRTLACAALTALAAPAQQVRVAPGLGVLAPTAGAAADEDPGAAVEMFENPNLDNYLRRSRSLLERQDFTGAIELLQDVIEGKTVEVVAVRQEGDGEGEGEGGDGEGQPGDAAGRDPASGAAAGRARDPLSARNAVFSQDGRLYRPVRRLCHELLAEMPAVGVELYRTAYEFEAEEMLTAALASGSTAELEQVANRYFITLPAGRAMVELADRLMHAGRYRAAVQVLRDLLETYPRQNRDRLGIRDVWCEFKIVLCLRLAGELDAAQAGVSALADDHAEESLRILGQLESVRDLPTSALFARDTVAIPSGVAAGADAAGTGAGWLAEDDVALVPLWQYRFEDPAPYRDPKPSNKSRSGIWIDSGPRSTQMPFANRYGPATWVAFGHGSAGRDAEPRALYLEHFRLRMSDAASGLLLHATDGELAPPKPRENHPRVRVAAADHALLRPVEDERQRYVVLGHEGATTSSDAPLKASQLVAYDRGSWERSWSSSEWLDGEDGLRDVTFLAAPTVFGEQLLLPALRGASYTLECLDRGTGRPLWHTPLHAGGTPFFKAPGVPVAVRGGVAFVATNAGCVAAVDAFAGDLKWIRRYERVDPVHKRRRRRSAASRNAQQGFGYRQQFTQSALESFHPSDLVLHAGCVVIAPCDGDVLMALDSATGEPVWMLDANTHHAPYGRLTQVIGADAGRLFVTSRTHLVCVELDGGLVRWMQKLPTWPGPKYSGRGRGAVAGGAVIVPNLRELLVFDADNRAPMRRLPLPSFDQGREPLQGACNVVVSGPWLAAGFQGGVEVYSTAPALAAMAARASDPLRRASYFAKSGDAAAAEAVLAAALGDGADAAATSRAGRQLLSLVRARAMRVAADGDLATALAALDGVRGLLAERELRLRWHLARVEVCKAVGDLRAHEAEQQRLYDYMEGRG